MRKMELYHSFCRTFFIYLPILALATYLDEAQFTGYVMGASVLFAMIWGYTARKVYDKYFYF